MPISRTEANAQVPAGRLTIRRATPDDARTIAALFHSMYRDSSHPFRSLTLVSEFLEDSRNFQIVAQEADCVVASMAMTYQTWNDSYELGRALTLLNYRRNGLAALLMQQVVDWVAHEGLGELVFGYARVSRIADLGAALDPQMVVVGHDGGRNVANGSRETHLICCGIPRHARFTHVQPEVPELSEWRFVREIYSPLGLCGSPGAYPAEYFVSDLAQSHGLTGSWILSLSGTPAGAIEVMGRINDGATPNQIGEELNEIVATVPGIQHVTVTVLADKIAMIRVLAGHGFEISAYLPAWHKRGPFRYDCIQLVRRLYTGAPATQDFADWLGALEAEFRCAPIL